LIYLAFFASGVSGLIYQVLWVRAFGNIFGNTIHSAAIVVAVFMLGLGVGSHLIGAWADRRYVHAPGSLLRAYGQAELAIALLGFVVSITVPHLGSLVALVSFYSQGADGWYVPSLTAYIVRSGIAVVLLLPITTLMGGTLTLLVRHLVRHDTSIAPARIAWLYAANTVGAALGCLVTDFALIPAVGLLRTQLIAVTLNVAAGAVALALAAGARKAPHVAPKTKGSRSGSGVDPQKQQARSIVVLASVALGLTGFGALGMEILWFRHATILLGGFRAVFALLVTVVLTGIAVGAFAGGVLAKRAWHAASVLMVTQALFAVTAIAGILLTNARPLEAAVNITATVSPLGEIWFDVWPLLLLAGIPSLVMGVSFPLANALVQQADSVVARRAGGLYFANTAGAVCGSIATGFLLLPWFGIQDSAAILAAASALAIVPLYLCARSGTRTAGRYAAASLLATGVAIAACVMLPANFVINRAIGNISRAVGTAAETRQVLSQREGLTEVVTIAETRDGRLLLTNGHAMSSTARLSQRYMRALAHIPLLMMDEPQSVLVIGFGVGNTTHAATLHPTVRRVEIADLSRSILEHASYFDDANRSVLKEPRVQVFVNDGRQHLQIANPDTYDLITLEPPPIAYAGVGALYSKEFYELARSRLTTHGFVSQWLPTYQVPTPTALSMIRAFVDVFPQSVLLSGAQADLLLIGTSGPTIELDPNKIASALMSRPDARGDLIRLDLGSAREIAGAFVGSARTLIDATHDVQPVTDDWPATEYSVLSALNPGQDVPANVVTLKRLPEWCPRCFSNGAPVPAVAGLDLYMRLIDLAYRSSAADGVRLAEMVRALAPDRRLVAGSAYLGAIVPESVDLYNAIGINHAAHGAMSDAIVALRKAVAIDPESASSHWHLGAALAEFGARDEAISHLKRSVDLDPGNSDARADLDALTAASGAR
jgi:spermidine synthase